MTARPAALNATRSAGEPPPSRSRPRIACFVSLILCWPATSLASGEYIVRPAGANGHELEVTWRPPGPRSNTVKLATRGAMAGEQDQIVAPRCGATPLPSAANGFWRLPPTCDEVTWTVAAPAHSDGDELSGMQSTSFARAERWTLLLAASSLLRVVGDDTGGTLRTADAKTALFGATGSATEDGRLVPSLDNASEFYVVGPAPTRERKAGGFRIRDVADDLDAVRRLGLPDLHSRILPGLVTAVFGTRMPAAARRSLMTVWVGSANSPDRFFTAMGGQSFVSIYTAGGHDWSADDRALAVGVLASTQFNQLVQMKRDAMGGTRSDLPEWVAKSLSHYMALRTLQDVLGDDPAVRGMVTRHIDSARPVEHKFIDFEALHAADAATTRQAMLVQGATFWHEMDKAIANHTPGAQNLTSLLPALLAMEFPASGDLPAPFRALVRAAAGPVANELMDHYVGKAESESLWSRIDWRLIRNILVFAPLLIWLLTRKREDWTNVDRPPT